VTARDTPAWRALDAIMRPWWWLPGLLLPFAVLGLTFWLILKLPPGPQFMAEHELCDRAVTTLLTTHDAVDLQRAAFLVRYLRCSIGDRLQADRR
jgi:hypothetical protein